MGEEATISNAIQATATTVEFYGKLAKDFQPTFSCAARSPYEAIQLAEANAPGKISSALASGMYIVLVGGQPVTKKLMHEKVNGPLDISVLPVIGGAVFVIDDIIIAIVIAVVISVGISLLLAPGTPKNLDADAQSFQDAVNVNREGVMLPILMGRTRAGSIRISSERSLGRTSFTFGEYDFSDFSFTEGLPSFNFNPVSNFKSKALVSRQLHAVSEGPIKGLVNGPQGVLFNDTALMNEDGTVNFDGARHQFASGTDPNDPITLITETAAELDPSVSAELQEVDRVIRTVSAGIDAVRILIKTPSFYRTTNSGRQRSITARILIDKRLTGSGDPWEHAATLVVQGIHNTEQFFQSVIHLDNTQQYDISVNRETAHSTDIQIQDTLVYENLVQISNTRVRYDGTALIAVEFDNDSFGGRNPETEFILDGLIVDIPSNYDPYTRLYTGVWDGTYKKDWTNNPAFLIQHVMTNNVWGLGKFIADRFSAAQLYTLGVFCDVPVMDGKGGFEPRYTLNYRLSERKKAMIVIRELAGVFRGQAFWDGTEIGFVYDQPRVVAHVFTPANIIDGDFTYTGVDSSSRVNRATVSYFDADDRYRETFEAYQDHQRFADEGPNEKEVESFSTSAGQAQRQAKFLVKNSTGDVLKFSTVEEGGRLLPGQLIVAYDTVRMGRDQGGRISVGGTVLSVPLDRPFTIESGKTYSIRVTQPDGTVEERTVTNAPGVTTSINVSDAFSVNPTHELVWAITASDLVPAYFTVVDRQHAGDGVFSITANEYVDGLFNEIETGIKVDESRPTSLPNPNSVAVPQNLVFRVIPYMESTFQGDLHIGWSDVPGAIGYDVYYSVDNAPLQLLGSALRDNLAVLKGAQFGDYRFAVKSRTEVFESAFAEISFTFDENTVSQQLVVTGVELFEQGLDTEFRNQDAKFVWRYAQSSTFDNGFNDADAGLDAGASDPFFKEFIIEIRNPNGTLRRNATTTQNNYEYTLERNLEDGAGEATRSFTFIIKSRDIFNRLSLPTCLEVTNPQIAKITNANLGAALGAAVLNYKTPAGTDWAGTKIHIGDTSGFTPSNENERYDVKSSTIPITADEGEVLYVRFAAYDTFGEDGLNYSDELTVTIPAGANAIALLSYMTPQYGDMAGLESTDFDVEGGNVSMVQTPVYIGNQSVCLDANNFEQTTWFTPNRSTDLNLNLQRGSRWLLTGWFRTTNANPANVGLRAIFKGNVGAETANTGGPQALTASGLWERRGFILDLTSNEETAFAIGIRSGIGTTTADLYMDGFSLFDVSALPQYTEAALPPITYVPSLGAGVGVDGKDGQPGLPGASYVLSYDDLSIGSAAGGPGTYSFGTNDPNDAYVPTDVWATITSPGAVKSLYIHTTDATNVHRGSYLSNRNVGEIVTWLQAARRWVEFRITSVSSTGSVTLYGVEYVEHNETSGNENIDPSAGVDIEFRFSGAQDGIDGFDGTDGRTIDLPGIVTRGLSGNIKIDPNLLSDRTANPGEYFMGAGVVMFPDGTVRTFANNFSILTPFEGVLPAIMAEKYNFMHFVVSGPVPAENRFGAADGSIDPFDEGCFSMLVDFSVSPVKYYAVDNSANLYEFTPGNNDFVLGAGYKRPTTSGGIEHFTPYYTRVNDVEATKGARLGDNLRSFDNTVLNDIDLRNDELVQEQFSSINQNPNLNMPRRHSEGFGPANWFSSNNSASNLPTYTDYPNSKDIVRIPFNKNMANTAFRVNPNTRYEVLALVRSEGGNLMPGLRVQELDGEFTTGQSVVGWEFATGGKEAQVVQADRSFTVKSQTVTNNWTLLFGFYTPTSTARWASIDIWTGNVGSSPMQVDWAIINERSTEGAQIGVDLIDGDGLVIGEPDIKNSAVLSHNAVQGVFWLNYSGSSYAPPARQINFDWEVFDGDDVSLGSVRIRASLNISNGVVTLTEPNGRPAGFSIVYSNGTAGNSLGVTFQYTHASTGRVVSHETSFGALNTGGGGGK